MEGKERKKKYNWTVNMSELMKGREKVLSLDGQLKRWVSLEAKKTKQKDISNGISK